MKTQTLILVLAAVVFSTGCTTMKPRLPKLPKLPSFIRGESESAEDVDSNIEWGTPEKMLAIWKDSVRSESGKQAMRGFGGRIFLYDQSGSTIRAKGELVIYGFDDSVKDRSGSKADKKIVLANARFQKSYSKSGLGDSYNVWFDWDEVGGPDKSVTLIPFFRTPDGKIIKAGQSIHSLHAPKSDDLHKEKLASEQEQNASRIDGVSQANYVQNGDIDSNVVTAGGMQKLDEKSTVRTTTIFVPKETQKRLRESNFGLRTGKKSTTEKTEEPEKRKTRSEMYQSMMEEARKKRGQRVGEGRAFGKPGQL